jgi:hypothetical protein
MQSLFNNQYKNLASKGRYGDTMLAHINPQEAGMLRAMGGAGTINPQTGLREFYDGRIPPPSTSTFEHTGGLSFKEIVNEPFDRSLADIQQGGMGVYKVTGYTVPSDQTFAGIPLVTKYDPQGGFNYLTLKPGEAITPDPSQPNIISVPRLDASGNVIDWGITDTNNQDNGSFGSFVRGVASDFAPMIVAGLLGNYAAGNLGSLFGGGAAGGAAGGTLAGMGTGAAGAAALRVGAGAGAATAVRSILRRPPGLGSLPRPMGSFSRRPPTRRRS